MMFTVETNYAVRNGIMYGVAKITGPRGVRTIAVHAPLPKNTGITISGEHTEMAGSVATSSRQLRRRLSR